MSGPGPLSTTMFRCPCLGVRYGSLPILRFAAFWSSPEVWLFTAKAIGLA